MTNWLKWRLGALMGGALLMGGATTYLHAQSDGPAPAKSPEEAATQFTKLLSTGIVMDGQSSGVPFNWPRAGAYLGAISRVQMQAISGWGQNGGPERLFALLAQEQNDPQFEARVTGTTAGQTLVEIMPSAQPKNREIVVIEEDGGYRVDLKATFARWNELSGEKLDQAWFRYTGEVSPTLAQNSTFLSSQCQSNMKQQILGVLQYAQDYDEKLPPARRWIDVLQPYVRSEQIFKCPTISGAGNGYAYNQNLSQYRQDKISDAALTVNIYETSNLARNVFGPGTGRAYRHASAATGENGWNLAFADGHVKYFSRGRAETSALKFKP